MGLAHILVLLQGDLCRLPAVPDDGNGILGVDVHAGDFHPLGDVASQLPLVDVPVGIIGVAVIGNEAQCAVA